MESVQRGNAAPQAGQQNDEDTLDYALAALRAPSWCMLQWIDQRHAVTMRCADASVAASIQRLAAAELSGTARVDDGTAIALNEAREPNACVVVIG